MCVNRDLCLMYVCMFCMYFTILHTIFVHAAHIQRSLSLSLSLLSVIIDVTVLLRVKKGEEEEEEEERG